MNPDQLGPALRSKYVFKETHVPTTHKMQDIRRVLATVVAPAIRELDREQAYRDFLDEPWRGDFFGAAGCRQPVMA